MRELAPRGQREPYSFSFSRIFMHLWGWVVGVISMFVLHPTTVYSASAHGNERRRGIAVLTRSHTVSVLQEPGNHFGQQKNHFLGSWMEVFSRFTITKRKCFSRVRGLQRPDAGRRGRGIHTIFLSDYWGLCSLRSRSPSLSSPIDRWRRA